MIWRRISKIFNSRKRYGKRLTVPWLLMALLINYPNGSAALPVSIVKPPTHLEKAPASPVEPHWVTLSPQPALIADSLFRSRNRFAQIVVRNYDVTKM